MAITMTRITHLSNGKSVMVLGTVVGCLLILWPKVFYPMLEGGFQGTQRDLNLNPKVHPRMMSSRPASKVSNFQSNFHGPHSHIPQPMEQNTIGGASVGLIMTIYTIGIIFLFFYTIFKYISSNDQYEYEELDDDNGQTYCDTENSRTDRPTFYKTDHEQGECLKKLAINYIRCKSKLTEFDESIAMAYDEDGVSMAYRTLLGDMLELRNYLNQIHCSINGCDGSCDESCDCFYPEDDVYQSNDFGDAMDQHFDTDKDETDTKEQSGRTFDQLDDNKWIDSVEGDSEQLTKHLHMKEE